MIQTRFSGRFASLVLAGVVLLRLALSAPLFGQAAGGTIQGIISDPSGAAIAGAQVTVTEIATGVNRVTSTNEVGFFAVPNLQPALYSATVTAQGFSRKAAEKLTLTVGATLTVNFSLKVGSSAEEVEVRDTPPDIDLATSDISEVVDSTTMRELPLNGRDWSQCSSPYQMEHRFASSL